MDDGHSDFAIWIGLKESDEFRELSVSDASGTTLEFKSKFSPHL
jgi:hypothetical protein